jgi:hypothetical protein
MAILRRGVISSQEKKMTLSINYWKTIGLTEKN